MDDEARFRGYTPREVAELTNLYGEHELRRMAARGEIPHHRGARNRIIFFADDLEHLLEQTKREPVQPAKEPGASASPFRETPRSAAIHQNKRPFPPAPDSPRLDADHG